MNQPYLEITYRHGKPLAAYLYLARRQGDGVSQSELVDELFLVDRAADGRPIGVEILDPDTASGPKLNELLRQLDQPILSTADLAPLRAA